MDSLLIVLVVIGVIMILAGVARMRSKRRHGWDEIDHSVLFSRAGQGQEPEPENVDEPVDKAAEKFVVDDAEPELNAEQMSRFNVAEEPEGDHVPQADNFDIKVDADDAREHERSPAAPAAAGRVRSILDKLRGESDEAEAIKEDSDQPKKGHKLDAPDKVIVMNVMAPEGQHFVGPALIDAIEASGLRYGDMQIFHYYVDEAPIFGLVNMVKPGVFNLDDVERLSTPGVSLFIQMPSAAASGTTAFDTMFDVAQQLAQQLGGELRDERRSVLTTSAIDHLREQIAEYDCKWLATG